MIIIILPDRSSNGINSRGRDPRVLPRKVRLHIASESLHSVQTKGTNSHYNFITIIEMYVSVKRFEIQLPSRGFLPEFLLWQKVNLIFLLLVVNCHVYNFMYTINNIGGHPSNQDKLKYSSSRVILRA